MWLDAIRGKRVVITGASTGIGAAVAEGFGRQKAHVAVHYGRSEPAAQAVAEAIRHEGGTAVLVHGDLTRRGEARRVVEDAAAALGGIDVLINNAGAIVGRTPFLDVEDSFIDTVFDLNVRSVIAACKAAIPHLETSGEGTIINVGSIAGIDGGGAGSGMYACAKAYVHNLTRHLARDLAGRNIRVNTISPGVIDTPFHASTPPERMEAMRKSVHLGRVGTPADCVGSFLFLASAQMSGYITGQNIHINGGQFMP